MPAWLGPNTPTHMRRRAARASLRLWLRTFCSSLISDGACCATVGDCVGGVLQPAHALAGGDGQRFAVLGQLEIDGVHTLFNLVLSMPVSSQ